MLAEFMTLHSQSSTLLMNSNINDNSVAQHLFPQPDNSSVCRCGQYLIDRCEIFISIRPMYEDTKSLTRSAPDSSFIISFEALWSILCTSIHHMLDYTFGISNQYSSSDMCNVCPTMPLHAQGLI
jgi:hypothetical protein